MQNDFLKLRSLNKNRFKIKIRSLLCKQASSFYILDECYLTIISVVHLKKLYTGLKYQTSNF